MTTTYRDAAETLWGVAGTYAHDTYARLRTEHYPELPEQLPINIGLVAYGHCIGLTRVGWDHGPRISIFSSLFSHGRRQVDDLLTHEMLHAWLFTTGQDHDHDSKAWYSAVQRLSPAVLSRELDIRRGADRRSIRIPNPAHTEDNEQPKTVVRKVRTDATPHADVARWPQAFRPEGYDWGQPIRCPSY